MKRNSRTDKKESYFSQNRFFVLKWLLIISLAAFLTFVGYCIAISDEVPSMTELENPKQQLKTVLYSKQNTIIGELYSKNRTHVTFEQLPEHLVETLIAREDARFFEHSGIDILRLVKGTIKSAFYKLTGVGRLEGGSTLSMQTAGNQFVGRDRNIKRKVLEVLTALQLERTYSKKEIIEIYFNTVAFSHNAYGIGEAAKTYFSKPIEEITIDESAILVAMLKGPSIYNPISNPESAIRQRNIVLRQLERYGKISKVEYDTLSSKPIIVKRTENGIKAPYFRNQLDRELQELGKQYGFDPQTDGLKVYSTLDTVIMSAMDSAITNNLPKIQQASLNHSDTQWLRKVYQSDTTYKSPKEADSAFFANHVVQFGFIVIDQTTGEVIGHRGGRDGYYYDHVFQGSRQPGSTVKPFVYAVAIDNGLSPATRRLDVPINIILSDSDSWSPTNWDEKYEGPVTLRHALAQSKNVVTVRLMHEDLGERGPHHVKRLMRDMKITSNINPVLSIVLGVNVVTPIELASAYSAFANRGIWVQTHTISRILDKDNNEIYRAPIRKEEVLNENTAFLITSMLQSGVNAGTSGRIRYHSNVPRRIKVAGKTGTTQNLTDIWAIAYTPRFVACVWFGMDQPKHKINLYSSWAVPVVGDLIRETYEAHTDWKPLDFEVPDGIVELEICDDNDEIELAIPSCTKRTKEYFRKEFAPAVSCRKHDFKHKKQNKTYF
jgi:penicillin-binding protein 1A